MKLTLHQKMALPVVKWLLDQSIKGGNRATGRTTLVAYAFIELALENPNTWVYIRDINPELRYSSGYLKELISQLWNEPPFKPINSVRLVDLQYNEIKEAIRITYVVQNQAFS